jgi:hypothetical protein
MMTNRTNLTNHGSIVKNASTSEAELLGRDAFISGKSVGTNPFPRCRNNNEMHRTNWFKGWYDERSRVVHAGIWERWGIKW